MDTKSFQNRDNEKGTHAHLLELLHTVRGGSCACAICESDKRASQVRAGKPYAIEKGKVRMRLEIKTRPRLFPKTRDGRGNGGHRAHVCLRAKILPLQSRVLGHLRL